MSIQTKELNAPYFGQLTNRMNRFRESVLMKKPYIDAERALLATEAYQQHQNQPSTVKRALMLQNILEKMTIFIEEET
ncbi:MAG: pyruvate formate lyase family protein, partial [Enterococcus devriesei]|uniref:pyruvate formate lyase family protein n=1 Tax=Enterococcus devriesei TaxID=319970 RepID=UPI003F8DE4FF